jgi:hypothetical protein
LDGTTGQSTQHQGKVVRAHDCPLAQEPVDAVDRHDDRSIGVEKRAGDDLTRPDDGLERNEWNWVGYDAYVPLHPSGDAPRMI